MMKFKCLISLFVWMVSFPGISLAQTPQAKELRIGWISQFPDEEINELQPLADYLEMKLKPFGYTNVRVVISGSIHSMAHLIDRNKVDLFFDSVLPTLGVDQITNMVFLLRQWKNGIKEYQSVVFVKKDEPIQGLKDLGGYTIAMMKPYSTSGYLIPRFNLEQQGMKLHRIKKENEPVPQGQVGYLFTFDRDAIFRWVENGSKRAGAASDYHYRTAEHLNKNMKIIFKSEPLDRHVVSARAGLDPKVRDPIVAILLNMDKDPLAKNALKAFADTQRFDELPGGPEGFEKSLAPFIPYLREELNLK